MNEWAQLRARAMLESRSLSSIVRSSTNYYTKYGPWRVNKDMIAMADKLKELKPTMVLEGFDIKSVDTEPNK
jgi:hypothetical protein